MGKIKTYCTSSVVDIARASKIRGKIVVNWFHIAYNVPSDHVPYIRVVTAVVSFN
jgi:hypothetical protein